jgi:hypothetical protein
MHTVFISYRRGETAGEARALYSDLAAILGKDSVFMDVDTIALGRDFRQVLRERLESCDLLLALVGRNWVDSSNPSGQRRLEDPDDYVRLEIDAALKRNIPVIPVRVQGAEMPTVEQLPEAIRDFAYRNAFELSHNRWNSDVQEMTKRLGLSKQEDPRKRWLTIVGGSLVAMVLIGGGVFYYQSYDRSLHPFGEEIEQARKKTDAANTNKFEQAICGDVPNCPHPDTAKFNAIRACWPTVGVPKETLMLDFILQERFARQRALVATCMKL